MTSSPGGFLCLFSFLFSFQATLFVIHIPCRLPSDGLASVAWAPVRLFTSRDRDLHLPLLTYKNPHRNGSARLSPPPHHL